VLNLDVQGAELAALKGANKLTKYGRVNYILAEIMACSKDGKELIDYLTKELGCSVYPSCWWGWFKDRKTRPNFVRNCTFPKKMTFEDQFPVMCDYRRVKIPELEFMQLDVIAVCTPEPEVMRTAFVSDLAASHFASHPKELRTVRACDAF
jgi:hypothetical protein